MVRRLKRRKQDGKYMIQVLLARAEGRFYVNHIENELHENVNTFTKKMISDFVKKVCAESEYKEIQRKDNAEWEEIVRQRAESNRARGINDSDETETEPEPETEQS